METEKQNLSESIQIHEEMMNRLNMNNCNWRRCASRFINNNNYNSSVAIIGGGMSGLGSLKELKEVGFDDITLFEYTDDIGGVWNYNNKISAGYKGMVSNTSYRVWPYSDYIYECEKHGYSQQNHPEYTQIHQVYEHLSNYTKHFNLSENIQFNSKVTNVTKNKNTKKWDITVNEMNNIHSFDRVVICNGVSYYPQYPQNVNIDDMKKNFYGNIYHSAEIKQINSVKNKNVLVIGNSISGCDAAEFACMNGAKCVYNLYREPRLYAKLWNDKGFSVDPYVSARNNTFAFNEFKVFLDEYGFITPSHDTENLDKLKIALCKNFEYFCKQGILKGIHGEIDYASGNNVYLNDSKPCINDIDIIIFATGFDTNKGLRNMLSSDIINKFYNKNVQKHRNLLYLLTFIAGFETDNIAIVGGNINFIPMIYELQARLIGQIWSGNVKLPSIEKQHEWIKEKLIDYDPYWFLPAIPCVPYVDDIADFIGILPEKNDFPSEYEYMYDKLQNDVYYPSQFRIRGHGSNNENKMKVLQKLSEMMKIEVKDSTEIQAEISGFPARI
eukprot:520519_1